MPSFLDGNGSLILSTPGDPSTGSGVANGAKRYTYNTAGFLLKVETYTNSWQTQAEMLYDGLGNRLEMTSAGLTTQYELDGGRVLSADAAGNVTYYLYGLGPIGELTDAWSYSLPDGAGTPRQLTDAAGEVTFAVSYTPWGDTLETFGTGRFTQGYFGGMMDSATGLLYVGNGQYYDPATGRFLTRDARPGQNNPYIPVDPTGALLGPLALLALAYGRKKSRGKWDTLVILLVLSLSLGVGLAACGSEMGIVVTPVGDVDAVVSWIPKDNGDLAASLTLVGNLPGANGTPERTVILTCWGTLTPILVPDEMDGSLPWGKKSSSLYKLYLALHETKTDDKGKTTWWWKEYGQDGNYTLVDFVATMMIREVEILPSRPNIDMKLYVEAMGRHAYRWCDKVDEQVEPDYLCNSGKNKRLMYFAVSWSQVVIKIEGRWNNGKGETIDTLFDEGKDYNYGPAGREWALKIASAMHNPQEDWKIFDKDAPYDAGNIDPQVINFQQVDSMHKDYQHYALYEFPKGSNKPGTFFITTYCETLFLQGDINNFNSWGCKLLPNGG